MFVLALISVAVSIQHVDGANEQAKHFNKSTFALTIVEPISPTYSETGFKGGFIVGLCIGLIVLMINVALIKVLNWSVYCSPAPPLDDADSEDDLGISDANSEEREPQSELPKVRCWKVGYVKRDLDCPKWTDTVCGTAMYPNGRRVVNVLNGGSVVLPKRCDHIEHTNDSDVERLLDNGSMRMIDVSAAFMNAELHANPFSAEPDSHSLASEQLKDENFISNLGEHESVLQQQNQADSESEAKQQAFGGANKRLKEFRFLVCISLMLNPAYGCNQIAGVRIGEAEKTGSEFN
jgi:hypothetical protein